MGIPTLITATNATSNVTEIDFSSGITSAYDEYMFVFINIDHAGSEVDFQFQVNSTNDDGGDYDVSLITTSHFYASKQEVDSATYDRLVYTSGHDKAQEATFQNLGFDSSNGADDNYDGIMHLFNPASTTFVKHFYSRVLTSGVMRDHFVSGYINDTYAIDDIRFKMSDGGNFTGSIHMYGIS